MYIVRPLKLKFRYFFQMVLEEKTREERISKRNRNRNIYFRIIIATKNICLMNSEFLRIYAKK